MNVKNKTVGILSMQRVINYGSFLQAYALKQLLLTNGAEDVSFIDIRPGKQLPGYEAIGMKYLFKKAIKLFSLLLPGKLSVRLRDHIFMKQLGMRFTRDYFPMLGLERPAPTHYDLVVIGSDEVFNCCQMSSWGYTPQLYGDIPNAEKVISYAGSFGHTIYEQLKFFKIDSEIADTLKKVSAISVRDSNSADIITKLTGVHPLIHLDPVLIYDFSKEIENSTKSNRKNYIIVYSYQGRITDKQEVLTIRKFAKEQNKRLISIFCQYDWCDETIVPDTPFDVLPWFKGADYIVTDTFHGTIFSIITERPFVTLIRNSNKQKISYLLDKLKLQNRIVTDTVQIPKVLIQIPNYSDTRMIIQSEKCKTNDYLQCHL